MWEMQASILQAMDFYADFLLAFFQAFVMPFSLRALVGFVAENWLKMSMGNLRGALAPTNATPPQRKSKGL